MRSATVFLPSSSYSTYVSTLLQVFERVIDDGCRYWTGKGFRGESSSSIGKRIYADVQIYLAYANDEPLRTVPFQITCRPFSQLMKRRVVA